MIATVRLKYAAQLVTLLLLSATLPVQQTTTFSTDVRVVNVLATVRDSHGNIVNTLTKDDFVLEARGRSEYRHIVVSTKQKNLKVQAREGYYPSHPIDATASNDR